MRTIEDWFDSYARQHRHPTNVAIQAVGAPIILWSIIAMLWLIPVPREIMQPGAWAILAMFVAFVQYHRLSRNLSWAMALVFIAMAIVTAQCYRLLGVPGLLELAIALLLLGWIGQFAGYRIEGGRPSWTTRLGFILIGPAWLVGKLMRRLGIPW